MENTNETRSVQSYRHEARRTLVGARERLALRTDETHEVYRLLNGAIEEVIRGRQGVTQEEQVSRLTEARDKVNENLSVLPEKVEAARASVLALLDSWEQDLTVEAQKAAAILDEAATYASERDFDAWQEAKAAKRGYGSAEAEDDEEDEDDEPDF